MSSQKLLGTVLVFLIVAPIAAQNPDPRRDPTLAVAEMIRLLEKKDHATLLKTFATPEELERLTRDKTFDARVVEFANTRAAGYLLALQAASKMKPTFNDDRTRAYYRFEKPIGGEPRISLQKIGEFWYLR